eukprot:8396630-Alexandrium_andersonii.AAC.1
MAGGGARAGAGCGGEPGGRAQGSAGPTSAAAGGAASICDVICAGPIGRLLAGGGRGCVGAGGRSD